MVVLPAESRPTISIRTSCSFRQRVREARLSNRELKVSPITVLKIPIDVAIDNLVVQLQPHRSAPLSDVYIIVRAAL